MKKQKEKIKEKDWTKIIKKIPTKWLMSELAIRELEKLKDKLKKC